MEVLVPLVLEYVVHVSIGVGRAFIYSTGLWAQF